MRHIDAVENLAVRFHQRGYREAQEISARLEYLVEIGSIRIEQDRRAVEIGGGELRLLQQRPALTFAKDRRRLGGIVDEDLDARHEGGIEHPLQSQRADDGEQYRRDERNNREKAHRAHMQARRRLAPPPDAVEPPGLHQHHGKQNADECAVDDEQRQQPVVCRRQRAKFRHDEEGGQSATDGADHDDRAQPGAKRTSAFCYGWRNRISRKGHAGFIGLARICCN